MNWFINYKFAQQLAAPHRNWKSQGLRALAPFFPDLAKISPRQLNMLLQSGETISPYLVPIKEQFLSVLQKVWAISVGQLKGNLNAVARKAADLARKFFSVKATQAPTGQSGRMSGMSVELAFQKFVTPHLDKPMPFRTWRNSIETAGKAGNGVNPNTNMGYAGKVPQAKDYQQLPEYRALAQAYENFKTVATNPTLPPQQVEKAGKLLANATNAWLGHDLRNTSKRKDVLSRVLTQFFPERYNSPQGASRWKMDLTIYPKDQKYPSVVQWKQQNRTLLDSAWRFPPYFVGNQLSVPFQSLINNLKRVNQVYSEARQALSPSAVLPNKPAPAQAPTPQKGRKPAPQVLSPKSSG